MACDADGMQHHEIVMVMQASGFKLCRGAAAICRCYGANPQPRRWNVDQHMATDLSDTGTIL